MTMSSTEMIDNKEPTSLAALPMELLDTIFKTLGPLYLKQARLTSKKLSLAVTRRLFRKLYITFSTQSYNNLAQIAQQPELRILARELVWDLNEIQEILTDQVEFVLQFRGSLEELSDASCLEIFNGHTELFNEQCALKRDLESNILSLRRALQLFPHVKQISMAQSGGLNIAAVNPALRLSSGMLHRHGTWALPFPPSGIGMTAYYAVGTAPIYVALRCLIPCPRLTIVAYTENWHGICTSLNASVVQSALPHLQHLDICLFTPHPGPYFFHDPLETERFRPPGLSFKGCCTSLESIRIKVKDYTDPDPHKTMLHFGCVLSPFDTGSCFPKLQKLTLDGFWMPVSSLKDFLKRHRATLRSLSVRKAIAPFGDLGEVLEHMRELRMDLETVIFEDIIDNSYWRHPPSSGLTVREVDVLNYLAGRGPNPCPIPNAGGLRLEDLVAENGSI